MCFFEEGGPLFAGASKVGREERSRKESDDTSYDVFVGRFETSVFQSRGSDARTKKKRVSSFSLFPRARNRTCESWEISLGDVPRCTFGKSPWPFSRRFRSIAGNERRSSLSRAKKNPRARLFTGKVLNVRRGRETRRGAHHATRASHARETRALDARSSRGFLSLADFTRISRQTALGGGTAEDHATHFSRDRLSPEASRAFFERAFDSQTARTPRCAGGDPEPKHRTRESGRGGASRCFSARCFSAAARPSRR